MARGVGCDASQPHYFLGRPLTPRGSSPLALYLIQAPLKGSLSIGRCPRTFNLRVDQSQGPSALAARRERAEGPACPTYLPALPTCLAPCLLCLPGVGRPWQGVRSICEMNNDTKWVTVYCITLQPPCKPPTARPLTIGDPSLAHTPE